MPDFGLTEALAAALKASRSAEVMRPAEVKLAGQAARTAPGAAAPAVPAAAPFNARPVAQVPSVDAAPATPRPASVQAPPLDPSVQPQDIPAPQADDAAVTPTATPAPADIATSSDGQPATPASPEPPVAPASAPIDPNAIAPANTLPVEPALTDVQQSAQRFVSANLSDFSGKLDMTHMPNVETMATPDGVKAAILQIADDNKDAITAARRGTITDEQMIGLAQDFALNKDVVSQVLSREFGDHIQRPEIVLAARMVEQQQMGTLLSLAGKVADGSATSEETVRFQQQAQIIQQYRTQLSGAVAEQGRGMRAMQIPVGLPSSVMDHVASVVRQNAPDLQTMAQAIKLAGTPSGIANIVSGPLWRRTVTAGSGLLQRIYINGILSGPPTWAKIFLGNNLNLALNGFDLYAAGVGRGMVGLASRLGAWPTAAEGATLSDAIANVHGVISGGADALRVAGRVMKTGQSLDGIMRAGETATPAAQSGITSALPELNNSYFGGIARAIDTAIDIPGSRVIGPIDEFTKTLGYRGYVTMMSLKDVRARLSAGTLRPGDAESAMLDMMKNPSPELAQAAEDWAHRMTFQSPFDVDGPGQAFQNLLNKAPALRFIFPFMRTATNIFKQSMIERTPLAAFSAKIRNQIAAGGFEGDLAKSRIATGTAIGSMLAWMAIHDRITGDAPKDAKARAEWELDGRTPYSVRITDPLSGKDTWRSYSWFEPLATTAGAVADVVQLQSYVHHNDDVNSMADHDTMVKDAIAHTMASIIENTGNKTFMQGAAQFAEMYNDPQRALAMWAGQMGAAMVPYSGALKFVRNEQDPYLRQANTLMDKVRNEMPGVGNMRGSTGLPARLDVFGEPRKTVSGNSILGPLNPLPGSPAKGDAVTDEIQDIMEQTRTVPITMPSQQVAVMGGGRGLQDGQGMRLTPKEYSEYVRMSRADPIFNGGTQTFRERLEQTINSPVYQQATPAQRAVFLEQVQNQADKIGRERLFKENTDFAQRMTDWTAQKNRLKFGT